MTKDKASHKKLRQKKTSQKANLCRVTQRTKLNEHVVTKCKSAMNQVTEKKKTTKCGKQNYP